MTTEITTSDSSNLASSFSWVSDAGGPDLTFAKNRHDVVGMPEAGWRSSGDLPDNKLGRSLHHYSVTEDGGHFMREIFKNEDDQLNFKITRCFGESKYVQWKGSPKTNFCSIHTDCISFDFQIIERSGVTFWKGGNEVTAEWTGFQGVNKIRIIESLSSDPEGHKYYRWTLEAKSHLLDELQSLLDIYTGGYQFRGKSFSREAAIDDALSVVDKLREVCAKIAAIGPAVVPVAQAPHPLDNFWSDQESKLSRSVAENQISNDPAFNQILDDVDPFIVPLDDLLSLIEQAPDDRSKGFLTGVYQCRTQFEIILAGSAV